ncbi:hypothetical protein EVAR_29214_1 [Eumeta japonica]|uniref:Uncharacterized protein n=1 Tax=Eumeta variegata TaxID=151549 RepID=A0A4C1VID4_EUMVA|nr:hypothetical protein EVAR_29214_1 [Eumeta japonica]
MHLAPLCRAAFTFCVDIAVNCRRVSFCERHGVTLHSPPALHPLPPFVRAASAPMSRFFMPSLSSAPRPLDLRSTHLDVFIAYSVRVACVSLHVDFALCRVESHPLPSLLAELSESLPPLRTTAPQFLPPRAPRPSRRPRRREGRRCTPNFPITNYTEESSGSGYTLRTTDLAVVNPTSLIYCA